MHPTFSIVLFTTASGAGFGLLFLLGLGVPLGLLPRRSAVRVGRPRDRLRVCGRRARLFGVSSRAARAGLARLFAMALVLAVARGRAFGRDRVPGRDLRDRLGVLRRRLRACRSLRDPRRSARGRDDLLHRHDLRLAEADPSMAQPLGRAELFCPRPDGRLLLLDFLVRFWPPAGRHADPGRHRWSSCLGGSRKPIGARSTRLRRCSTVASATLLGSRGKVRMLEPPHTEDNYLLQEMGFRDRPQAPRPAAPDRAARRFRACPVS